MPSPSVSSSPVSWLVWQLADSAFPTGGFAHSAGLEAHVQLGHVRKVVDLEAFVRAFVWQVALGALPFVGAAWDEPAALAEVDAACDAFVLAEVPKRASQTQGRALLAAAARIFPDPRIEALYARARARETRAHHAPVFGAVLRWLDVPRRETLALFLHGAVRSVTSAGVRLGAAGPHEAQALQSRLGPELDVALAEGAALSVHDVALPAPVIDLVGSQHDGLYARLFQS